MNGNKTIFIKDKMFYKEYTKNEFYFLKMLHGSTGLNIELTADHQYITMPAGHVISIDTIKKKDRHKVKHIITKNIPFMLQQISLLNNLGIYYADAMQWLYHNNKLYLIDMDVAYFTKIDYDYNNYDLLYCFLSAFDIDCTWISDSMYYLQLFQETDIEWTFYSESEKELYNKLNIPSMQKNHVYFSHNRRHIQLPIKNIHVYGESGNMIITEHILNPEVVKEWELIRII